MDEVHVGQQIPISTTVQKAFVDGVPGCTEHHLRLLSVTNEARRKHKSLALCVLDRPGQFLWYIVFIMT